MKSKVEAVRRWSVSTPAAPLAWKIALRVQIWKDHGSSKSKNTWSANSSMDLRIYWRSRKRTALKWRAQEKTQLHIVKTRLTILRSIGCVCCTCSVDLVVYMGLLGWVILLLLAKSLGLVGFNRICHVLGSDIIFVINSSDEHCWAVTWQSRGLRDRQGVLLEHSQACKHASLLFVLQLAEFNVALTLSHNMLTDDCLIKYTKQIIPFIQHVLNIATPQQQVIYHCNVGVMNM